MNPHYLIKSGKNFIIIVIKYNNYKKTSQFYIVFPKCFYIIITIYLIPENNIRFILSVRKKYSNNREKEAKNPKFANFPYINRLKKNGAIK